ncbi:MAG TPA: Cd(II)/Pb(II)-responsive transcriptional regulator [Nevskiales bacterium]|nr:Cd(II)/Pb(II)-responsive transcriptional regulator [Nevskiales bacterium]
MNAGLRIGQLAKQADCQVETIRYYEREGLLPKPKRTAGNYRLYGRNHLERLSFIRHCRSLDMTHDEIRTLLRFRDAPGRNCAGVNELLDAHVGHVSERIRDLRRLKDQLEQLRHLCHQVQTSENCGILRELSRSSVSRVSRVQSLGVHTRRTRGSRGKD